MAGSITVEHLKQILAGLNTVKNRKCPIIEIGADGQPIMPEVILTNKRGQKLGVIENLTGLNINFNFNSPFEISFQVDYKHDGKICSLWNNIKDFKLVYIKSLKLWFEIYVSVSDKESLVKRVTGIHLEEAELSQTLLFNNEYNTESDIARDDYEVSTIYNPSNPKASILNRMLEKTPHYKIYHVDNSIARLQRTFSFNGTSIYDAFNEIAKEINCIFIYGEDVSTEGKITRSISVYDLENYCPECHYRGDFNGSCPKCGNSNIIEGYGQDTTIFASTENLSDSIDYSVNTDSVKNCFRLETGDDLMTATVMNCNPNGSAYIWYISQETRDEMSGDLQVKLSDYDALYTYYENEYESQIPKSILDDYDTLIKKYQTFNSDLTPATRPVVGYSSLMNLYYETIDFYGYLKNTLMPSPKFQDTSAEEQISFLTNQNLSPIAVSDSSYISLATANSAVISYAKVYLDTSKYKVSIKESALDNVTWIGKLTVESYTDEEDTATTENITILFNDDQEQFVKQKIDKLLAQDDDSGMGIVSLFKMDDKDFKDELKKHCLSNLTLFDGACQSCIDILIENDIANPDKWIDPENDLYNKLYLPYLNKASLIGNEAKLREEELAVLQGVTDTDGGLLTMGLQDYIEKEHDSILNKLDFENYLGVDLWTEFVSFRREGSYSNSNYISDGLTNAELIQNAMQFLETARKEIIKSATLQHKISSTLKNLLLLPEFEPILEYFKLGNWIRIGIDSYIFKLRLISFAIDFDNMDNLKVTFSDVTEANGVISDTASILAQAKNMATSYSSVAHQAQKGSEANSAMKDWIYDGLDLTNTKIVSNAYNQNVIYNKHGILCRQYDDITDSYHPEQIKIINKGLYFTNDNWNTAKTGIGEFQYVDPKDRKIKTGYGVIAETIVSNILLSNAVGIYNESQSIEINKDGFIITATPENNSENLFTIQRKESNGSINKILYMSEDGNANFTGKVIASSGSKFGYWTISDDAIYYNNENWGNINGKYFGNSGLSITDNFLVDSKGNISSKGNLSMANGGLTYSSADGLIIKGKITSTSGSIGGWDIHNGYLESSGSNKIRISAATGTIYTVRDNGNQGVRFWDDGISFYSWYDDGNYIGKIGSGVYTDTNQQYLIFEADVGDSLYFGVKNDTGGSMYMIISDHANQQTGQIAGTTFYHPVKFDGGVESFICSGQIYATGSFGRAPVALGCNTHNIQFNWTDSHLQVWVDATCIGTLF